MTQKKKLIVIVGPTAVGKTAVAISLAQHLKTEIVSSDSRQIFKELGIGTARPTDAELATVPHHFVASHSIHDPFDAARFEREAIRVIDKLFQQHDHLILCGGSGLYIKAVCDGFDAIPKIPSSVRAQLVAELESQGIGALQVKMRRLDPDHFETIDKNNPHRLIRALEVILGTGNSITSFQTQTRIARPFRTVKIGLQLPREELYRRIDVRMDKMIADGLFKEAEGLYPHKKLAALQTVGYKEIFDFMDGKYDYTEAVRLLKRNTRRYAKRQETWFMRDPEIVWMNPANIEKIIATV